MKLKYKIKFSEVILSCAYKAEDLFKRSSGTEPSVYTHYLYDAGGNRVKKYTRTAGGNWETITYIDGLIEYRENDKSDYQSINHVMDDSRRIATIREGKDFGDTTPAIKYNLDDHLGSSNVLVDADGAFVNIEEYYPFGETSFGSYANKRYRFCGKEKDEESGMYYYGARYYSPWLCRFISVDPKAGKYVFQTPYAYADNNPINKMDYNGEGTDEGGGGGAASGGPIQGPGGNQMPQHGNTRTVNGCTEIYDGGLNDGKGAWTDPPPTHELKEVTIRSQPTKQSFFSKAANAIADNLPVIGGLKYAYESFKKGDWVGVLTGVGEAVLDVALIVTTAGIGNAIKQSAKIGIKTTAKYIAKETAENAAGAAISEQADGAGIPKWAQITLGVTLGLHAKGGVKSTLTNKQAKEFANKMKWGEKLADSEIPDEIKRQTKSNPVYYDRETNRYYSPDRAGHRAENAWKQFDKKGGRETGVFIGGKFNRVSD